MDAAKSLEGLVPIKFESSELIPGFDSPNGGLPYQWVKKVM